LVYTDLKFLSRNSGQRKVENRSRSPDHSLEEAPPKWDPEADRLEFLEAAANAPKVIDLNGIELVDASFIWSDMDAGSWMPLAEVMGEE
jgi:hypothetical protein